MGKFFDIHIEVGDKPSPTGNIFYAKTILGNNAVKFEYDDASPAGAISKVVADMEATGMWGLIIADPKNFAPYPFGGSVGRPTTQTTTIPTPTTPSSKKDAVPVRQRPVDLLNTPKGECEAICISYDNFGVSKCATMCRGKK